MTAKGAPMKIALLGGTFNPIHIGHLILAEEAREQLELDKVIFVPANLPPHKENECLAPARLRFEMVSRAIRDNAAFEVSDVEIRRAGLSYTIDTALHFRERYAQDELFFICGSDILAYLGSWQAFDRLRSAVQFVVATRPGYPLERIPGDIRTVAIRAIDVSAYEIRKRIAHNRSFRYLVPAPVYDYIREHGLYVPQKD